MGIGSEVGVPGQNLGRGSPLQTWVRQVRSGGQAPGSCSPPPQETLQSSQVPQVPNIPGPGQADIPWHCRMAATQVLGTRAGLQKIGPCLLPRGPSCLAGSLRLPGALGSPLVTRPRHHLPGFQALPGAEPRPCGVALVLRDP